MNNLLFGLTHPVSSARVRRGADKLDTYFTNPDAPGWWWNIDCDRLDLANPRRCILGQLFESQFSYMAFPRGAVELGLFCTEYRYGFVSNFDREAWLRLIAARRRKDLINMPTTHPAPKTLSASTKELVHA